LPAQSLALDKHESPPLPRIYTFRELIVNGS